MLNRAETTQQEVVHAITAGTLDHVPGMADAGSRADDDRPRTDASDERRRADVVDPEEPLPPATPAPLDEPPAETLGGYRAPLVAGVRAGELGSLPIIVGLVVIAIVFGTLDDTFFRAQLHQPAPADGAMATIAIGVVFVLLIGEIDLSVAYVSAVGRRHDDRCCSGPTPDWPWWAAVAVALIVTTFIGLLQALVITKAGVPSFVVTLAGLLIWSGVVLILTTQYSTSGTIRIQDETVVGIANNFLSDAWGWVVAAAVGWPPTRCRRP